VHGGLRYLEYYEFRLVREALIEREVLIRNAPHLTKPLRFVLTRAHVMLLAGGSVLAAVLIVLLGVGVGARLAQPHPSALSRTVTSQATPPPGVFLR